MPRKTAARRRVARRATRRFNEAAARCRGKHFLGMAWYTVFDVLQ